MREKYEETLTQKQGWKGTVDNGRLPADKLQEAFSSRLSGNNGFLK